MGDGALKTSCQADSKKLSDENPIKPSDRKTYECPGLVFAKLGSSHVHFDIPAEGVIMI